MGASLGCRNDFLHKCPAAFVLLGLEVVPLCLYLAVQFQFDVAFGVFEAQLLVDGDEV